MKNPMSTQPLIRWLWLVAWMVVATVWVGGMTRLTESGLSMVDWNPLMGSIPPISQGDWEQRFADYQAYPEYLELRPDMALPEFKTIFLWEYGHRMLGRLIGVVFLLPYLYFLLRRQIPKGFRLRIFIAFLLGGSQGLLGWYMVKSGLVDNPQVSHFRLTAHFSLALIVLCYLVWTAGLLSGLNKTAEAGAHHSKLRRGLCLWTGLLSLQIVYGAMVAGLNAGYSWNTFPKMLGRWIPPGLFALDPAAVNLVNNPLTVQFIHRVLAVILVVFIVHLLIKARKYQISRAVKVKLTGLTHLIGIQFLLGIATLVMHMPIALASLHQVNICLILIVLVRLMGLLKDSEAPSLDPA